MYGTVFTYTFYRTIAIQTRLLIAAQIDGHCPDIDFGILSRIKQKLELIGKVSLEIFRCLNCIDSTTWNNLHADTLHYHIMQQNSDHRALLGLLK